MAMHDEIREQQQKLKGRSFKEKLGYFWDYYKIHTFVVLLLLIVVGSFVWDIATTKEEAFSATLLNAYGGEGQESFQADFAEYAGIDTDVYSCYIDATSTLSHQMTSEVDLAVFQRTIAMAQTGGLDVVAGDPMPFTHIAGTGMFLDLKDVLTEEEYTQYEPYFYYIDGTILENDEEETYKTDTTAVYNDEEIDHTDPSSMEKPIPVGIFLPDSAKLQQYGCYALSGETPILGFIFSSTKLDTARQFLHFLTEP